MTYQEYPCEGYTNVYITRDDSLVAPNTTFRVHPDTEPLVNALVAARPRWTFKSSRGNPFDRSGTIAARTFDVYEDGNAIGDITTTTTERTGEQLTDYCYDNDRLRDKRQRGSWSRSTKLDVAVKGILKSFHAKTINEIIHEKEGAVSSRLSRNSSSVGHIYQSKMRVLQPELNKFLMDNWATVTPMLKDAGISVDDTTLETYHRWMELESVTMAYLSGYGCTIHTRGSDYIVVRGRGEDRQVEVKASEELSDTVRRNLGLLKLSEAGRTIPDIGMRESDNTFFVMDKADND